MFYSQLLLSKKGALGTIWIAAHCHKRLKKDQVHQTNITSSVDKILLDEVPVVTYRILGHLLVGVVRIYSKKVEYLFHDCHSVLVKLGGFATRKRLTSKLSDANIEGMRAPNRFITRPKRFELDAFEVEVLEDQDASSGHVASREEIMLSDAWKNEQAGFGLSSKCQDDVSHSESWSNDHTPVRDVRSPHLMDKGFDVSPSVGSGHMEALWNLHETRFSLEERFEPMTFGDIEVQTGQTSDGVHQTDDEQMKEANIGNLVAEEHLCENRPSLEEGPEPMIIDEAENNANIDQSSDDIRQPNEYNDEEGPAGPGEPFVEEHLGVEQMKNPEGSSAKNMKDQIRDEYPVTLCVDVTDKTKFPGSTSPNFIAIRTPAAKERARILRKRKCVFDDSIVIPNGVYKLWIRDANDLVCKRRKAPHTSFLAWKAYKISSLPQSFLEPLIPSGISIDVKTVFCKNKPTNAEPVDTVEVPLHKVIPECPDTLGCGEQTPIAPSTPVTIAPSTPVIIAPTTPVTIAPTTPVTIAPSTPVTSSNSLRLHEVRGISKSDIEPASSIESTEIGAVPVEDQELDINLVDEDTNSFEGDTLENYNYCSLRTRKVARYLLENFLARKRKEDDTVVNLSLVLKGKTKKESARVFYEILVLKSGSCIDVRQDDSYGDVLVQELPKLKQTFEAGGISSKS